jgi:ABC-type transport system substrate-binding protein
LLLLGFVAAACGGGGGSATGTSPPAAEPNPDATIRIASDEDRWPFEVTGRGAGSTHFAYVLNVNVYEPLIYLASDYTLKPGLAERWELQPDGRTWRFFLRRGVTFHDGSPFTADDVVWTWGVRQMEGKTLPTVANTLGPDSVRKVDDFTVDFTPTQLNLRLPEQIVHPEGAIVKRNTHNDTPPYAGTGPFRVVSYTPEQSVIVERNDDYWGERPKAKRLEIRFIPDRQTRLEALRAGQVDFVIDIPPDAVRALESDSQFRVVKSRPGRNHLIYLNKTEGRLTSERAVREAISHAVDRRAYVDVVLDGNGEPGRYMAIDAVLGQFAGRVAPIGHDPGRARRVLDEAGWRVGSDGIRERDGAKLRLILLGQQEVAEDALIVIQSNLKDVGIDVEIRKTPDLATRNSLYAGGQGDFDLDLEPPNQNDGNPAFLPVLRFYSKTSSPRTAQFAPNAEPATPNGPEFDAEAEKSLAARTTPEAQAASARMMQILINEDYIVVPLAGVYRIYGMSSNVALADPHPSFTNQTWVSLQMSNGS